MQTSLRVIEHSRPYIELWARSLLQKLSELVGSVAANRVQGVEVLGLPQGRQEISHLGLGAEFF